MAATERNAILLAALALPGLGLAEEVPEHASISLRYLDYQDSQKNLDRIQVRSPSVELLLPVAGQWAVRASLVSDTISGASPRYHTAVSGASHFNERRIGADVGVTRYFARSTYSLAAGRSGENDYVSHFMSAQGSWSSEDNNTTWAAGMGVSNDTINPVNFAVKDARKHSTDFMASLTQVLSQRDLLQGTLSYVRGRGYFDMPYKYVDTRPNQQDQHSVLLRWNHALSWATSRMSYRYYKNSWGIQAHTLSQELVLEAGDGWTFTPALRYHGQSAASFYFDPVYDKRFGPPFPPGYAFNDGKLRSADQRLAAYGAVTWGLKLEKTLGLDTTLDVKYEDYQQKAALRQFGAGSPGLAPFYARSIQIGLTRRW